VLRTRWSLAAQIAVRYELASNESTLGRRQHLPAPLRRGGLWVAVDVDVLGPPVLDGTGSSGSRTGRRRGVGSGSSSGGTSGCRASIAVRCSWKRKGEFVNFQGEPDDGRLGRGRPGGVYIIVAAIVAITIIVLLIILIF
jgi:hypothetical protein